MRSEDRRGCLVLAASGAIAVVWMVWGGPGPGGAPFTRQPWWQWPFEAGIIALTWFWWTLMIVAVVQGMWLLAHGLYLAAVHLLIRLTARP